MGIDGRGQSHHGEVEEEIGKAIVKNDSRKYYTLAQTLVFGGYRIVVDESCHICSYDDFLCISEKNPQDVIFQPS
jgi:hypothetical protein